MPNKGKLLRKLFQDQIPKNFTVRELDQLMSKCNCISTSGGRGSSVKYIHVTGRVLQFDFPHPGNNLYSYQIKMVRTFLKETGEDEEEN